MILITGGLGAGQREYAQTHFPGMKIVEFGPEQVRQMLQSQQDPVQEAEKLAEAEPDAVILTQEVGCGIVPMDAFERKWREACGRSGCALAERAESVWMVVCGQGIELKKTKPQPER